MKVIERKKDLQKVLRESKKQDKSIGLVPTMGALHDGHLSLVKKSLDDNSRTVVSVFVNPTQFDNQKDLEKYPRNLKGDLDLLASISEEIIVFAPTKSEIYDGPIVPKSYNFEGLEKVMEGEFRTGHFNGVGTIVELLLKAVEPDRAYFGEKDFQQLQIIKKLVRQLRLPLKVISCPIDREDNGLARSSRNERLSPTTRKAAGFIHETLKTAKSKFGTENANTIKEWVRLIFNENELFELEYFEIADVDTLTPMIKKQENRKYRAFIAVYAEEIRLIDNIAL